MHKKKFLQGTVKRNPDGFGFFIPDKVDHPDVYIPRHSMLGVMTSDRVMIEVEPEHGGERFRGEIIKIISRGIKKVVGQYFRLHDGGGLIRDEGKGWGQDLKIKPEDSMNAANGELVAADILTYPEEGQEFRGRIVEVLGDSQDPLIDIRRVLLTNNIPHEFSSACLREAEKFSELVDEKDMKGRRDIRHLKFVTIDGATAKDFDDAIYVEINHQGFLLYVAIADVSHYVQVGSAIDKDAYERGTSVYFPNFVVPMLPEVLSNGLCSLNPHVPRLALVAEMQMDFTGEVIQSDFYEAVIESKARVTYGEAQEIIEDNKIDRLDHVVDEIKRASDLAKILMAKRFKEGSLDLEIPDTQMVIDASGNPIDIIRSERLFAHRVIEEMMLAANVAVAKFLASKEIFALYRIHEPPKEDAIYLLEKYLISFGGKYKLRGSNLQKSLTKALQEFENRPEAQVLNILTLRSMSQAKYSHNNVGHFGLGFEFYTHFTSPIRRYPDLIVHRLLKNQVMPQSKYRLMSEDDLSAAGTMLSACEQRSVKAERQLNAIKKARFMEKFLGQELEGMISSVTKFGVFVLLRSYEIDGLVRIEDLGKDKYEKFEFDEEHLRLVQPRSGKAFSIGDNVKIQVTSVDIEAGQINFKLVHDGAAPTLPAKEAEAQHHTQRHWKKESYKKEDSREERHRKSRKASGHQEIEGSDDEGKKKKVSNLFFKKFLKKNKKTSTSKSGKSRRQKRKSRP
ncbi:MAG: ribonuclease R [Oligoflexia bacterium]|nr:MAG: ribonuclease R [Oligoflexia bacterium]